MSYRLRDHAARHFGHIPGRKAREHAAETDLTHLFFHRAAQGFYLDVGANEPVLFNQTWHFEQAGWQGLLIEPIPEVCARLRAARPRSTVIQAACGGPGSAPRARFFLAAAPQQSSLRNDHAYEHTPTVGAIEVDVQTLDQIIAQHAPARLDFVSIDVEGLQLEVLRGLSLERHRPRLLLLEDHLTDLQTHRYLAQHGYRLVKRTGLNSWYIPRGDPFALTSWRERWELFAKLRLRTPFRALIMRLKQSPLWPGWRRRRAF